MKTKILILLFAILIINACKKDKYQDKPVLSLKSASTVNVVPGGSITFNIEVSDKQGDIVGDTVFYWKKVSYVSTANDIATQALSIPSDLPGIKKFDAEFAFTLYNATGNGISISPVVPNKNDSCVFKFWMKDLSNHVSDTLVSPIIIIQHA